MKGRPLVRLLTALALVTTVLTGCLSASGPDPALDGATVEVRSFEAAGGEWMYAAHAGGESLLMLSSGPAADVVFPKGVLVFTEDGRLTADASTTASATPQKVLRFVPPPGAESVMITVGGEAVTLQTPDARQPLVSGANMIHLLEVQRDNFPHRTPGHENYALSHDYFISYFEELGYDVEYDPYDTMAFEDARAPAGATRGIGPSSFANIVAYKPGANAGTDEERFLVIGGHYDVVEETVHGAFDNTAGTVAVMELARVFADVETEHTLVFGLWGGEEDGILGSRFWVESNPDKVPKITAHVNLDVTGLAWPGPVTNPDPILVTGAPDGPLAQNMLAIAREVYEDYAQYTDAPVLYEPWVVGGQAGGSGINAQSDHTSFAGKGIPSYMISTGNIESVFALIHKPSDTLENMTAYMATGQVPFGDVLSPEDEELGREVLARSFEAQVFPVAYFVALADAGVVDPRGGL